MRRRSYKRTMLAKMPAVELQLIDGSIYESKGKVETISGVIDSSTGSVSMYYTLLMLDRQLEISKETADILKRNTETMQAMKDAALYNTTAAAVEQSRTAYGQVLASLPEISRSIHEESSRDANEENAKQIYSLEKAAQTCNVDNHTPFSNFDNKDRIKNHLPAAIQLAQKRKLQLVTSYHDVYPLHEVEDYLPKIQKRLHLIQNQNYEPK